MAAGVADHIWKLDDIAGLFDQMAWYWGQPKAPNPFPPALVRETFDEYMMRMTRDST